MPEERLSKFLAHCGIASRRKCDAIIASGRVTVNDIKTLEPFATVNPLKDRITVDGRLINTFQTPLYIALYKPTQFLSDLAVQGDRNIARSLIRTKGYLFPVGRLDYNSEGLIFFTNDGDFAYKVTHPKFGIEKEYLVKFKGMLREDDLSQIAAGILIEGSMYRAEKIAFLRQSMSNSWYRILLHQGKNRMIRKIGDKIGHPALKIKRIRIGCVRLGDLKPGQYRNLTEKERDYFLRRTALPKTLT